MNRNIKLYLICILIISTYFGCSTIDKINNYNSKGYTFILNKNDTLDFDKIYLDDKYKHTFEIDKNRKTITYISNPDSLSQLLNFRKIEELYKENAEKIAFIIFQGDFIGTESKFYIQRSLLESPERIKDEEMAKIRCNGPQGDVLIFK